MKKFLIAGALAFAAGPLAVAGWAGAKPANPQGGTGSVACNDGTVSWSPTQVWPPNHKPKTITVSYHDLDSGSNVGSGTDDTSVDVKSVTVIGSTVGAGKPTNEDYTLVETAKTAGDDDGSPDAFDRGLSVLSERSGQDMNGRTYLITATCTDSGGDDSGESEDVNFCVSVPHDQHHAIDQTDLGCTGVVTNVPNPPINPQPAP